MTQKCGRMPVYVEKNEPFSRKGPNFHAWQRSLQPPAVLLHDPHQDKDWKRRALKPAQGH
jgi:hypothetical protein